jgi:hypothetical protein
MNPSSLAACAAVRSDKSTVVVSEDGGTASISVRLIDQPDSDVVIDVSIQQKTHKTELVTHENFIISM